MTATTSGTSSTPSLTRSIPLLRQPFFIPFSWIDLTTSAHPCRPPARITEVPGPGYELQYPIGAIPRVCHVLYLVTSFVGCGGALVKSMTLNRRVVGSTPALALPVRFGVKLRYSIRAEVGSPYE